MLSWGQLPLRYSLPLLLLVFGVILIVFEAVFFSIVDVRRARVATETRCERTGERVARMIGRALTRENSDIVRRELSLVDEEPGFLRALTVTEDGQVPPDLNHSRLNQPLPESIRSILAKTMASSEATSWIETDPSDNHVTGGFPIITEPEGHKLALILELDLKSPIREAQRTAAYNALASAGLLVLACFGLWRVLDRVITRRVSRILDDARAIATERAPQEPMEGSDELSQIDRALHSTHAIIATQAEGIRSQERRYRTMVESLPAIVYIAREDGIEYMNATGLKILGLTDLKDVVGKSAFSFIPSRFHDEIRTRVADLYKNGGTAPTNEEEIIRADGSSLAVEVVASLFTDAKGPAIQVIMHDISERKAADARREALGREISNASEREQRRIGQDLHDDICQRLAAVKMSMQDLEESLAEHAPALMDEADAIVDRLTDAIGITRGLARGLSPVDIEAGGLGVALTGLARNAREVLGVECALEMPDELRPLPSHAATQFYRIAQECINNAAKHGKPSFVHVQLAEQNGALVLRVSNDGKPFTPDSQDSQGMGLHIMRHRAESMGAQLDFENQPADASVAVRCSLPLSAITKNPKP